MRKIKINMLTVITIGIILMVSAGCSKSQSYSELLREEERASNWYLANQNVCNEMPEDIKDVITSQTLKPDGKAYGEDAPFYRLDEEGYVYMQVVSYTEDMVAVGDLVYFRFLRQSIKDLYEGLDPTTGGNSDYLPNGSASFVYKNTYLSSTTTWGTGIQMPLQYVGYNSEVNLVLKSYYGFTEEQSYCIPYIINIKYFKPEY